MTGTETALLRVALAALRSENPKHATRTAYELLRAHYMDTGPLAPGLIPLGDAVAVAVDEAESWRHVRARVALYVRALLRAERGEHGFWWNVRWEGDEDENGQRPLDPTRLPWPPDSWERRGALDFLGHASERPVPPGWRVRLSAPLWTLARAHGGRT